MPVTQPAGPRTAKIAVVGEYPGPEELLRGQPFVGTSGGLLKAMLREAGIPAEDVFFTNVLNDGPPPKKDAASQPDFKNFFRGKDVDARLIAAKDRLRSELAAVNPNLILACGNGALWALTSGAGQKALFGVAKWAGSQLRASSDFGSAKLIPTYNPAFILRSYAEKFAMQTDLRRARREMASFNYEVGRQKFILEPSFEQVKELLHTWHLLYDEWAIDIETAKGQIECVGIAVSDSLAMCIPLMDNRREDWCYWTFEQELEIRALLRFYMSHPRRIIIGQNFDYDMLYFIARFGFWPRVKWDTMIMSHILYCELPKSLDYLARLWARNYVYWKDDGKATDFRVPPWQRWEYNCRDCCYTFEIAKRLEGQLRQQNLLGVYTFRVEQILPQLVGAMLRGIRVDKQAQIDFAVKVEADKLSLQTELDAVLGHPLNVDSPKQMKQLFIEDFGLRPVLDRKTKNPTFDDDAIVELKRRYPLLVPVFRRIQNIRTARTYRSNYGPPRPKSGKLKAIKGMQLDADSRARTYYKITGTDTYRLASTRNVFGSGRNLQNIPRDEDHHEPWEYVPNSVKEMFRPDPGYILCEADLKGADITIVVEEIDDDEMREILANGDIYRENAKLIHGEQEISKSLRSLYKQLTNGTHYGGSPAGIASRVNIPVRHCEDFQRRYFFKRPGIKRWHLRENESLITSRRVDNCFGYRRIFFDRIEGKLGEALAWKPQSIVGEVINRAWVQVARQVPEVQVLLQVHDSLVFQVWHEDFGRLRPAIREAFRVTVPYKKSFEIGVGLSISRRSWGAATDKWTDASGVRYDGWTVPLSLID